MARDTLPLPGPCRQASRQFDHSSGRKLNRQPGRGPGRRLSHRPGRPGHPGRRLAQARVARVRFAPRRRDRAALDASAILDDAIDDSRRLGIDEGGRETALVGGA